LDDPFIQGLLDEFGPAGYIAFFGILEIYAREFSPEESWKLSVKTRYISRKIRVSVKNLLKIFQFLSKWEIVICGDSVTIYIPKFRTLLDEYTLKKLSKVSGQCRDSVGTMSSLDKDKDKDIPPISPKGGKRTPKNLPPDQVEKFEKFYQAYPKKRAKAEALKAWAKVAPENGLFETIMAALETSKQSQEWVRDGGQYVPHPATWINGRRWEDGGVESPRRPTW